MLYGSTIGSLICSLDYPLLTYDQGQGLNQCQKPLATLKFGVVPDIFSGWCVFIDHAIGYVSIKHQVDIKATETVKAKLTFDREAKSQGVVIKGYHTDNGIFNSSEFMEKLLKK